MRNDKIEALIFRELSPKAQTHRQLYLTLIIDITRITAIVAMFIASGFFYYFYILPYPELRLVVV